MHDSGPDVEGVGRDDWAAYAVSGVRRWEDGFGTAPHSTEAELSTAAHPSTAVPDGRMREVLDELVDRLRDNYPFFSPRYAGQMLKPPHPAAVAAYSAAMRINPNAHALDGGPATARLEREAVASLAGMFGFGTSPQGHLGHLTSSGTIANLEALFVARESHPGRGVAFSAEAHYTHARMCGVLGLEPVAVAVDRDGRMDLEALEAVLRTGRVGTVVATAGTTGLGAIDPVDRIVPLARRHGARVHVDAAYGGFFTLLATDAREAPPVRRFDARLEPDPWRAIAEADSVVVDPHKHGLQPYGCGAVLFGDPRVGQFYAHDSPYTYFTSDEMHLGEISLECSRAGAAAAALWTTLQLLPLRAGEGLGQILAACRRAALAFDDRVAESAELATYQSAQLDIVTYLDRHARTTSEVDASSVRVMRDGMDDADPVFVSTLAVSAQDFARRHPQVSVDSDRVRVLRSVLMKPEHEPAVPWLIGRLESVMRAGRPPR